MANEFDPDAYLKAPAEPAFDPDAYLGAKKPEEPLAWSDVPLKAAKNLGPSALQFGKDIVQPFLHPIDTAEALKNLGHGVLQKTGILSGDEQEKYADAVGKFFADRYGGIENVKKTLAEDPVGIAGDLSVLLTGGGAAAARAPGIIGTAGRAASTAGRLVDPLTLVVRGAELTGRGAAGLIGGLGTHTGTESILTAARSGYEGGEAGRAFRENMRGNVPTTETVHAAREALGHIRQERGTTYRREMAELGLDRTVLPFDRIDRAYTTAVGVKQFRGQDLSPTTAAIRDQMRNAIDEWRALDPEYFHTPEGMDALKQRLGDIRDGTQHGTPERVVADRVYQGVRNTIIDQAPQYARIMRGYEEASTLIGELERTLSLNPAASVDTTLRKLQSVLRNNVNTSFGRRRELAEFLIEAGSPQLMERLAGQAMQPALPRGLGRLGLQLGAEILLLAGGAAHSGIGLAALAPAMIAAPMMSPRLVGEVTHGAGRAARRIGQLPLPRPRASFQVGRTARATEEQQQAAGGRVRALAAARERH
jgi:hypothetical protein